MSETHGGGHLKSFRRWWATTGHSPATVRNYCYTLTRLGERLDGRHLIAATRDDLEQFLADRMGEVSPATVLNDFRALRAFYGWLYDEQELDVNPAARLRGPKVADTPVTVATEVDYKRLLAVCPKSEWAGRHDAAIIGCLWWGGFRRGELAVLDVGHVDLDDAVITIPRTKGGVPRRVPVHPDLLALLDRWLRKRGFETGPLFLSERGSRLSSNGIGQMFDRRRVEAGVTVSAHSFRRALATRWLRAGGSEVGLRAVAGWRDPRMVARYTRMSAEELAHAEYARLMA